jgi:hypothetical protein
MRYAWQEDERFLRAQERLARGRKGVRQSTGHYKEGDHMRKELSPPNTVSTAKVPLNADARVNMELRWLHVVDLHKFAVKQIEGLHRNDAWDIYFNALEWWRETYMDEPVAGRRSPAGPRR